MTEVPATERSLRNYIKYLKSCGLPDFGEYEFAEGKKVYIFAALLSNSRYKFVAVQNKPFTALDVILHLLDCFEYYEGLPEEIVIDQDRTMVVSENHGDIIFTKQFKYFQEEMRFKMHVCHGADPESKGTIENLAEVTRDLYRRNKKKELSIMERKLFENAYTLITNEISLARGIALDEAEDFVSNILDNIFIEEEQEAEIIEKNEKERLAKEAYDDTDYEYDNDSEDDNDEANGKDRAQTKGDDDEKDA